jgi:formamidopyrimidine-DNA glycosylase
LIPGDLTLTEAGSKRRAALHVVEGRDRALSFHKGGIDPLESRFDRFGEALMRENHTLKRALTDPRIVSGIGNSYSDEILHAAKLSPFKQTQSLSSDELERLHNACRDTLTRWITQLRSEYGNAFPEKVTAFKPAMAVHGKYNEPCPTCGAPVQRIRYAENECNYCPECQAGGTVFADRALSRLLKNDWPKSVVELEERGLA